MWNHLFFLFLSLSLISKGGADVLSDAERDLSLGFPLKALIRLNVALNEEGVSYERRLQIELLRLESLVTQKRDVTELIAAMSECENAEVLSRVNYWKGISEIQQGQYGKALKTLEALATDTDHPFHYSILTNLCRVYLQLGSLEKVEALSNSLDFRKNDSHFLTYLEVLLELEEWEKAKRILKEVSPERRSPQRDLYLSYIYFQEGNEADAIRLLEDGKHSALSATGRQALSLLSSIYTESGDPRALTVIKEVLSFAEEEDPLIIYFDQLLLATQSPEQKKETTAFLEELQRKQFSEMAPFLLYTKAQLTEDVATRLLILSRIYTNYSSHPLAIKASYASALLCFDLEDLSLRKKYLQDILDHAPDSAVKAKAYTILASEASGSEKVKLYREGLKFADLEQIPKIRLNYNLANFAEKGVWTNDLVLTSNDRGALLLERALSIRHKDPVRAKGWLEEFLTLQKGNERAGEAHMALAEILLKEKSDEVKLQAKPHLETVKSLYLNDPSLAQRYYREKMHLAVVEGDVSSVKTLISSGNLDHASTLEMGVMLYQSGYANEASQLLKTLPVDAVSTEEKDLADLYISLCYLKLGTAAHEEDALKRLTALSEKAKSRLNVRAKEILARYYFSKADVNRALTLIKEVPSTPDNVLLEAKVLGLSTEEGAAQKASQLLEKLYKDASLPSSFRYRVAYECALLFEENKKFSEALELYYQVANFESLPEPETFDEWDFYKRFGDKGIALQVSTGNWQTAHRFALLLAQAESPHREYFSKKASDISLKNILWDEENY